MIRIPDELIERGDAAQAAVPSFGAALSAARGAAALTQVTADASRALHELDRGFDVSDSDPSGWAASFENEAHRIREDRLTALTDPPLRESFTRDFDDLAAAKLAVVRRIAAAHELDGARARLDEALDSYAGLAAGASSDIEVRIVGEQAESAIARMDQAGYLRAGEADELRQTYAARQERAQLDGLMDADPTAAANALVDPLRFPSLAPDLRLRLKDRAELRVGEAGRAASRARHSEHQGRLAGLTLRLDAGEADRADIMQAVADGWLTPVERNHALALWGRRRDEIRRRDDDIDRVTSIFAGEGQPLDPTNPDDRRALDTHYDDTKAAWLAAGLREDQLGPVIADYLGAARSVPSGLRRDVAGIFRSGTPDGRLSIAGLLGLLLERIIDWLNPWSPPQERFVGSADLLPTAPQPDAADDESGVSPGNPRWPHGNDPDAMPDWEKLPSWPSPGRPHRPGPGAIVPRPLPWSRPDSPNWPTWERDALRPEPLGPWPRSLLDGFAPRDLAEALLINTLIDSGWPRAQAPDRAASVMAGTLDPKDRFAASDRLGFHRFVDNLVDEGRLDPGQRVRLLNAVAMDEPTLDSGSDGSNATSTEAPSAYSVDIDVDGARNPGDGQIPQPDTPPQSDAQRAPNETSGEGASAEQPSSAETSASPGSALMQWFANERLAMQQGTSPIVIDKDGRYNYERAPEQQQKIFNETQQITNTDKHVVLIDPATGKPTVFLRKQGTDEGTAARLGRLLSLGLGPGPLQLGRTTQQAARAGQTAAQIEKGIDAAGEVKPPPAPVPSTATAEAGEQAAKAKTPSKSFKVDLDLHEDRLNNGKDGHTLLKHVGKSAEQLRQRLLDEKKKMASSFATKSEAEDAIGEVIFRNSEKITKWLASKETKADLMHIFDRPIGTVVMKGKADAVSGRTVRVAIFKDATMKDGYRILTTMIDP